MTRVQSPAAAASQFLIGRDSKGHWVVQDRRGLHGGLFVDRVEALRFALHESGCGPESVIMVPGVLEFRAPHASRAT